MGKTEAGFYTPFTKGGVTVVHCMPVMLQSNRPDMCTLTCILLASNVLPDLFISFFTRALSVWDPCCCGSGAVVVLK